MTIGFARGRNGGRRGRRRPSKPRGQQGRTREGGGRLPVHWKRALILTFRVLAAWKPDLPWNSVPEAGKRGRGVSYDSSFTLLQTRMVHFERQSQHKSSSSSPPATRQPDFPENHSPTSPV